MSADRTRWNRAGLRRFAYVDGNGPVFLERLREEIFARFLVEDPHGRWRRLRALGAFDVTEESGGGRANVRRNDRLLEQFHGETRDLGWEIARAFSNATHVVSAHLDAHANEAFLRTASQWESLRRLVSLIDYHPAPAASASTALVLVAKEGRAGTVAAGFRVKHTPVGGGPPVVFETLDDIEVDWELNELRPAGHDVSETPLSEDVAPEVPRTWSELAELPAVAIQNIGPARSAVLDSLPGAGPGGFRIRDVATLAADAASGAIGAPSEAWMREFRAKARVVADFHVEDGWGPVAQRRLSEIVAADATALGGEVGLPVEVVRAFQSRVELVGACLDQEAYRGARLAHLVAPEPAVAADTVTTRWVLESKPKVAPGQVALVVRGDTDEACAARVLDVSEEPPDTRVLDLSHGPLASQLGWPSWPRGRTRLRVVPRLHRDCWLHGDGVIRTTAPHGLRAGGHVAWKDAAGKWRFAAIEEADDWGLRLDTAAALPTPGTPLHEARPLDAATIPATMEAIGLKVGDAPVPEEVAMSAGSDPLSELIRFPAPPVAPSVTPGPPFPGGLEFGSFLFPTPLLPADLVKAAVEMLLSIGAMVIPSTGEPVLKALTPGSFELPPGVASLAEFILQEAESAGADVPDRDAALAALDGLLTPDPAGDTVLFRKIEEMIVGGPLLGVPEDPPVKAIAAAVDPLHVCDGNPGKLEAGDRVVGEFQDGLRALRIASIRGHTGGETPESFAVTFDETTGAEGELLRIHGAFRGELVPVASRVNEEEVGDDGIELETVPELLVPGRAVVLETADGVQEAVVSEVDGNVVRTTPRAAGRKSDLVVRGNVVRASHGERKPPRRLSAGPAAAGTKSLTLEVRNVSSVSDSTFPTGVRAALDVVVAGRIWRQVARLAQSGPTDTHYEVRATEDGHLDLLFGDGVQGRRLPTGANNVVVRHRVGAGRAGNLPAGSLTKPVSPHPLLAGVAQPLVSQGGEERESTQNLRERAPATLLALERAVSLADFENLAARRPDVWQARAFFHWEPGERSARVRVVVVPAGGSALEPTLRDRIAAYLQEHAVPTVRVSVTGFTGAPVGLSVTLRVDHEAFDPAPVGHAVRLALADAFALERRRIGGAFPIAEVYRVVEGIRGVSSSHCVFVATEQVPEVDPRRVAARTQEEVVHLGSRPGDVQLLIEDVER